MTLTAKERVVRLVVPILLVVVAAVQITRAAKLDQSSYAGFGFGMFATYENELSRWTEVTVTDDSGEQRRVRPDASLDLAAQEVPTVANLDHVVASVFDRDAVVEEVRVEVWTVAIESRPMELDRVLLAEVVRTRGA